MNRDFDKTYSKCDNYFGLKPERTLIKFLEKIDKSYPILDVGAGQGRNSVFLAKNGFQVEAIDTSKVSVNTLSHLSKKDKLNLKIIKGDFLDFNEKNKYSCVLVFGLLPILGWHSINEIIRKSKQVAKKGGLIFITAFGTQDEGYKTFLNNHIEIGKNSFYSEDKHIRTFFEENEILDFFENAEIIYHFEGFGEKHNHGEGPLIQHYKIELVVKVN